MKKPDCRKIRKQIHEHMDRQLEMDDSILKHLKACPSCRAFAAGWERFSEQLEGVLNSTVSDHPDPDFHRIYEQPSIEKQPAGRLNRVLPWAAAFLAASLAWVGYRILHDLKTSQFIRQENRIFISQTLDQALLEVDNEISDLYSSDLWEETPPFLDSLFLPSSQ